MSAHHLRGAIFLLVAFVSLRGMPGSRAPERMVITSDLDADGRVERVELDAGRDPSMTVCHSGVCLWRGVPRKWRPWKLTAADVDGDGSREMVVGVHKSTRFFPKPHNCLFVYGWDGRRAFPKWLGSSLSKPFTDFAFADLAGDRAQELVSLEIMRSGRKCIVLYSWSGFGFDFQWQRGSWRSARLVERNRGRVVVEADGKRIVLRRGVP